MPQQRAKLLPLDRHQDVFWRLVSAVRASSSLLGLRTDASDHLFAQYPVPACMTWAWLDGGNDNGELSLYLRLAQGRSIRQFAAPFPWSVTKACARWHRLARLWTIADLR